MQHISLDHLNLQLASYELDTEAFASFRSRQLQASKALICDPTRSQLDMGEDKDEEEQEGSACLFLEDLQLVRRYALFYLICTLMMIINFYTSLTWFTISRSGHYLDEGTYMRLTAGDVVGFQCME